MEAGDALLYVVPYVRCPWAARLLRFYLAGAGLYLDSDVECWQEGADMLAGYDVVLQVGASCSVACRHCKGCARQQHNDLLPGSAT